MSFFQLPVRLCKELTQTTAAYWWGQKHSEQKMHWLWDNLCVFICNGGQGFRELQSFNLAMLAKQGWKFLNDPDSILAKIWKTM